MKKLALIMLLLCASFSAQAAVRCHVDVPYYAIFDLSAFPTTPAYDAIIYYNNSNCPFSLPAFDTSISIGHVGSWQSVYFNLWEASYSITGGYDNVYTFAFDQTRASLVNPACSIRAVSSDGKQVFLLNNYWIEGNMTIDIGHATDVSLCAGVF